MPPPDSHASQITVSPNPAVTSEAASDEESFGGFHESDIAKAKKRSARFAEFLRKYDCGGGGGGGGKQRRKSKSSGNNPKRRWFDGCQYRCGFCGLTFSQTSMLRYSLDSSSYEILNYNFSKGIC